jgi:hypothetical protein
VEVKIHGASEAVSHHLALAGTVPFLSFVAEHRVTHQTREVLAAS